MQTGRFGRPGRPTGHIPADVIARMNAYEAGEHIDEDWSRIRDWLVLRLWNDPASYDVVVARVEFTTEMVEVDR